jgi:hypothetical protein
VTLGILIAAASALGLYALWRFWPPVLPTSGTPQASTTFLYFGWHVSLTRDQQFLLLVALAGGLGAMLHGLRSLATYVGERYLFRSWLLYYALLPLVGAILATIVYLVLRAGLLSGGTNASQTDPYGIAAIAALVGLFSSQAAEKLKAVFETLFTSPSPGSESVTEAPQPKVTGFDPHQGPIGTPVVITGEGLASVTDVRFGGVLATSFTAESDTSIRTAVPTGAATGHITVHTADHDVATEEPFNVTP